MGLKAYNKLEQERFIDKSEKISDTIHRVNMKGFCTNQKKLYEHNDKKKKAELAYKTKIDITKTRGIPIESILPYDITQENYFFDQNGLKKKGSKSALIQKLEMCLTDNKKSTYQDQNLELLLMLWLSSERSSFRNQKHLEMIAIKSLIMPDNHLNTLKDLTMFSIFMIFTP